MHEIIIEYMGIAASFIILVALLHKSIKKLRFINLVGGILMLTYGILIQKAPVIIMNSGTVLINLYHLRKILLSKDYFQVLSVRTDSEFLSMFMNFFDQELPQKLKPMDKVLRQTDYCFFILRNMVPAGLFVLRHHSATTIEVVLDFATPEYRDFQTGEYLFDNAKKLLKEHGYTKFLTYSDNARHIRYLKRMDYREIDIDGTTAYVKQL